MIEVENQIQIIILPGNLLTIYVKQINDVLCENCVIVSRKKMLAYIKTAFLVPEWGWFIVFNTILWLNARDFGQLEAYFGCSSNWIFQRITSFYLLQCVINCSPSQKNCIIDTEIHCELVIVNLSVISCVNYRWMIDKSSS